MPGVCETLIKSDFIALQTCNTMQQGFIYFKDDKRTFSQQFNTFVTLREMIECYM